MPPRYLSGSTSRIGNVLVAAGDRKAALAAYRESLAISEKLAAADPANATWQRDLSVSHEKIGDVLVDAGDRKAARVAYGKSLAISEKLAAANPGNAAWCGTQPDKIEGEGDDYLKSLYQILRT